MVEDLNAKRNFRVTYYDKVGFRGIGEKALVTILKDDVVDRKKLENFCIRYPVQANHRLLIWKILLDVLPAHQQSHSFVMKQRSDQYHDLYHALKVMQLIDDESSLPEIYLMIWLLNRGELCCGYRAAPWHKDYLAVAGSVVDMVDDPVDGYWVSINLQMFFEKLYNDENIKDYDSIVFSVVLRDNKKLHAHLDALNFFPNSIVHDWHRRCFASVFSCVGCLDYIWDIVLGRGDRILSYLSAHVLLAMERSLMHLKTLNDIENCLNEVPLPDAVADLARHKAIESWKKYENII